MFESEFLTSESKGGYRQLIAQVAEIVCTSLPRQAYSGKDAAALAALVGREFLRDEGARGDEIAGQLRMIVSNSVVVSHPRTVAHLHCPPLVAALAAEVVITALNQSMDSFDQAPIATVLEQKLVQWLCAEAGMPPGAGGAFTAGATQSNYMGLMLARDAFLQSKWNWSAQKSGLSPEARQLRVLCSEVAHFTVEKSAAQLGLGTDSVVRVAVDEKFRMKPDVLRSALETIRSSGLSAFAVVATAGTTDFGSIDPLPEVASLAKSAGAWLHVDAAYGGALLFSNLHRHKLRGIENADSLSLDFHKLFWQPIPWGAFLLRDAGHFGLMKLHADYLNPESHDEQGIPNLVTKSLLTSRRIDALKLWISLQALGRRKLGAMIDRTIKLAEYAAGIIKNSPRLQLVNEPSLGAVVFRYVPSKEGIDGDRLNASLRQRLFDRGIAVIGHTRVRGRQCLKFTCMNPVVTEEQMQELIRIIVDCGDAIERE